MKINQKEIKFLTRARESPGELKMDLAKVGGTRRGCEIAPDGILLSLLLTLFVPLLQGISATILAPPAQPELLLGKPPKLIKKATFFPRVLKAINLLLFLYKKFRL